MKYYSFRYTRFYGGIATAYCSECNLECVYCYSQDKRDTGKERSAEFVAEKLIKICEDREIDKARISGGEITLDFPHLLDVLDYLMTNSEIVFYLETNGILLGKNPEYIKALASYDYNRLIVTVSLKHIVPVFFENLTKAPAKMCRYPISAVERMMDEGINVRIAYMEDWYSSKETKELEAWFTNLFDIPYLFYELQLSEEDITALIESRIDVETFVKYKNVPVTKNEIGALF